MRSRWWRRPRASSPRAASTVLVAAANTTQASHTPLLQMLPRLPLGELASLMRRAQLIIANGGSTLLQAIACQAPAIGVAIAKDQVKRVRQYAAHGLARSAPLAAAGIMRAALALRDNEPARAALVRRARELRLADGLGIALAALDELLRAPFAT